MLTERAMGGPTTVAFVTMAITTPLRCSEPYRRLPGRKKPSRTPEKLCPNLGPRGFFLHVCADENTALRSVESAISSELRIPATCLGATEIAALIQENKLLSDFADAIGLPREIAGENRPDYAEILLIRALRLESDRDRYGIVYMTTRSCL